MKQNDIICTFLFLYFICLLLNLQMCQTIFVWPCTDCISAEGPTYGSNRTNCVQKKNWLMLNCVYYVAELETI